VPILLVEEPGGQFWTKWTEFVEETLLLNGYISKSDPALFERLDSINDVVERIKRFYDRYRAFSLTYNLISSRVSELKSKLLSPALYTRRSFSC
jgi:predicted Rossmann-fold nucleotide-binding protein